MSQTNSVSAEPVTTLTVCILIDGKDILLDVFRNEDIVKGILVSITLSNLEVYMLIMRLHFIVMYLSWILVDDIGSAIANFNE